MEVIPACFMVYVLNGARQNGYWELALLSETEVGCFDEGTKFSHYCNMAAAETGSSTSLMSESAIRQDLQLDPSISDK
jgi:hypothetical protein